MQHRTIATPVIKTPQDLDHAVQHYVTSDLQGMALFSHWQAIRAASLELMTAESEGDRIPGEDSY